MSSHNDYQPGGLGLDEQTEVDDSPEPTLFDGACAQLVRLLESSSDALLVGNRDELLYTSAGVFELFGLDAEPDPGRRALSEVFDEERVVALRQLFDRVERGEGVPLVASIKGRSGDLAARVVPLPGQRSFLALFDRGPVEAARWPDDVLRAVAMNSGDGVHVADFSTGQDPTTRTSFVNERACEMLGYSANAFMAVDLPSLIAREYRLGYSTRAGLALARGEIFSEHVPLEHADGHYVWVETVVSPIFDDDGGLARVVSTWRDVTEHRDTVERLRQVERIAAVGALAAGIGHEINNPLAYAKSNVDYCRDVWGDLKHIIKHGRVEASSTLVEHSIASEVEQFTDALREATEGLERVSAIVRDLREFTSLRDTTMRPIELRRVVTSAMSLAMSQVRGCARLEIKLEALPLVWGNEAKLSQVFLNLILNAARSIDACEEADHLISIVGEVEEGTGRVIVRVSDTGKGISDEHRDRIFDPFFSTKKDAPGAGLGLTIAQSILLAHQGHIEFEDLPSGGACFAIHLNAAEREEPSEPFEQQVPARPGAARPSVLIIDDEQPIVRVLERLLSKRYKITGVTDARDALDLIERGARFDALVTDVMMPRLDGISFFVELGKIAPGQQRAVLFLTGGALSEAQHNFIVNNNVAVVYKPFDKKALFGALERLISRDVLSFASGKVD